MFYIDFTVLGIASIVLMALWAGLRMAGKKKSVALFVLAYLLLYVDYFALKEHFNFEAVGIMLGIAAIVAAVQFFRNGKKIQPSKELAICLLLSIVHGLLYLLVSV